MNILIICDSQDNASARLPVEKSAELGLIEWLVAGETSVSFLDWRRGPRQKIESRIWDIIVMTEEALIAIGEDEYSKTWLPPCLSMANTFIVENEKIS